LSAAALSKAIGKSASYVAKIESGQLEPSAKAFARIATVLELTDVEISTLVRLTALEDYEKFT